MSGFGRCGSVALLTACLVISVLTPAALAGVAQPSSEQTLTLDDLEQLDALLEDEAKTAGPLFERRTMVDVLALVFVLSFGLVSFFRKSDRLKVASLVLSVGYLGFVKASLVSIVDIFGAIRLSLPAFSYAVPYYLLIGFTVVSTVFWGRFYCGRICAFGALTQLLDRVVPARYRVELPPAVDRRAAYLKYIILVGAVVYVLGGGDTLVYRFIEPFWMFTLSGSAVMWTLLTVLLLATIFIRNLYCRYLCSVGAGLGLLSNLTVFRIKRWNECDTCKLCEKTCEWGAIDGPKILVTECVRCDDCERLYADESKCPHWLILARQKARAAVKALGASTQADR